MKKLILSGTALMLSLCFANAQTPGVTTTSAYDDFSSTITSGANGEGIYWWGGGSTQTRTGGLLTTTPPVGGITTQNPFFVVDFGTNTTVTPNVKQNLDLSTMADVEVVVENVSSNLLVMKVVLEDADGIQAGYEPNVSDCADVAGGSELKALTGFALEANTTKTFRLDFSSVSTAVGGLTYDAWVGTTPANSPSTSYDIDASNIHAVVFIFDSRGTNAVLSQGAVDKGSYKTDTTVLAANNLAYSGSIKFHSFKIGSVLTALPNEPSTGVNDALVNGSLKVYPNPAKDVLNVSFEGVAGAVVSLSDINGHAVYTTTANAGENNITLNTAGFATGMYILNIATENGKVARKVSIR